MRSQVIFEIKSQNKRWWKKWYVWSKIKKADNVDNSKSANDAYVKIKRFWLAKTSAFFMSHECRVVTRVQRCNTSENYK